MILAKEWGITVSQRALPMAQVIKAVHENRVLEMFGAGTAAIVSPIKRIKFNDVDLAIPLDPKDPKAQAGPLTAKFANTMLGIQYGEIPHKWSVEI